MLLNFKIGFRVMKSEMKILDGILESKFWNSILEFRFWVQFLEKVGLGLMFKCAGKLRCKNALVAATTTQLFCLPDFNEPQTHEDRSRSKNFISHDYFNQVIFTLFFICFSPPWRFYFSLSLLQYLNNNHLTKRQNGRWRNVNSEKCYTRAVKTLSISHQLFK